MPQFETIPAVEMIPLFHAEISNRAANIFQNTGRVLIMGLTKKVTDVGTAFFATDENQVIEKTGAGSMCHAMFNMFRKGNTSTEIWIMPIAENSVGVAATGLLTFTGTASADGILHAYIDGVHIPVAVAEGDTAAEIATALVAAISENSLLPVTAVASDAVVNLTAAFKGLVGNYIPVELNIYGTESGELTPDGITVEIQKMSDGMGNPDLTAAYAALGDREYDFILQAFSDVPNMDVARQMMNDVTGRWSDEQQLYGHVFTAVVCTATEAQTLGSARNDQHFSIMAQQGMRQSPWLWLTSAGAFISMRLINDPARPCQFGVCQGLIPPKESDIWNKSTRRSLLLNGISTFTFNNGMVQIERLISTYQRNKTGVADISYRDINTLYQLAYIIRRLRSAITSKYPDYKLADDGYEGNDTAVVTPGILKAELISEYNKMATQTPVIVENETMFQKYLVVERNASDVNRVDVLLPPDLINQMTVFAMLVEFRLNY